MQKPSIEIKGILIALLIAAVLSMFLATFVYFTSLQETIFPLLSKIVLIISILGGAASVSKAYGNRGLMHGISMGIALFILMLAATLIFNSSIISIKVFLYTLVLSIAAGAVGGIFGIGLSDN